jgi:transposase
MLGKRERRQPELFVAGSLGDLVPDDHVLVRVDRVLDLAWLPGAVGDCYCADNGRPGIDPEVAVRLMLAGLLLGLVHDRHLMREAQVNLAIRWFIGYGLHEALPDHSSLTRIRQRWGAARFRRIFQRTIEACVAAGIAKGEVVHIDSSLVRADVSWDAIARHHVEAVAAANGDAAGSDGSSDQGAAGDGCAPRALGKAPVVCTSDPDATLATDHRARRSAPAYKQHTAVDGHVSVVLDVAVTTGAVHDTMTVDAQLDAIPALTGTAIQTATMDGAYAITRVFASLEQRGIEAVVPAKQERPPKTVIPVRRSSSMPNTGSCAAPAVGS